MAVSAAAHASAQPRGGIVLGRDVPLRHAFLPGEVGRAAFAVTDPGVRPMGVERAFGGALAGLGVKPLADSIVGSVTSSLGGQAGTSALRLDVPDPEKLQSSLPTPGSALGEQFSGGLTPDIGNTVTGAVNDALGTVNSVSSQVNGIVQGGLQGGTGG
jgi:hypothetical protein